MEGEREIMREAGESPKILEKDEKKREWSIDNNTEEQRQKKLMEQGKEEGVKRAAETGTMRVLR